RERDAEVMIRIQRLVDELVERRIVELLPELPDGAFVRVSGRGEGLELTGRRHLGLDVVRPDRAAGQPHRAEQHRDAARRTAAKVPLRIAFASGALLIALLLLPHPRLALRGLVLPMTLVMHDSTPGRWRGRAIGFPARPARLQRPADVGRSDARARRT